MRGLNVGWQNSQQPGLQRDGADDDVWHGISLVQGFQSETERRDAFEFCLRQRPVWISDICKRVGKGRGGRHSLYLEPVWCDDGRQREHRAVDGNHVGLDVQFSRITRTAVSRSVGTQKAN